MATVAVSLRVPEDDLTELDRRASSRGMSRSGFLLGAALSDQLAQTKDEERFERIEARLARVEAVTFGS